MRPGDTALPVVSRVVRRHFWNGKGFSTRVAAYRARAKAQMMEMVLGPWVTRSAGYDYDHYDGNIIEHEWQELENAEPARPEGAREHWTPSAEERKAWIDSRFALFFPHDSEPDALQQGCMKVGEKPPWNFTCHTDQYGDHVFQSCKWAQEKWIRRRVAELMKTDESKTVETQAGLLTEGAKEGQDARH